MNPLGRNRHAQSVADSSDELDQHWRTRIPQGRRTTVQIVGARGSGKKVLLKRLEAINELIGLEKAIAYNSPPDIDKQGESFNIIVYDITNLKTFEWAKEYALSLRNLNSKSAFVLVGNKIDCEYWRQVSIGNVCATFGAMENFIEISAQLGLHVELLHDMILRMVFPDGFRLSRAEMIDFTKKLNVLVRMRTVKLALERLTQGPSMKDLIERSDSLSYHASTFTKAVTGGGEKIESKMKRFAPTSRTMPSRALKPDIVARTTGVLEPEISAVEEQRRPETPSLPSLPPPSQFKIGKVVEMKTKAIRTAKVEISSEGMDFDDDVSDDSEEYDDSEKLDMSEKRQDLNLAVDELLGTMEAAADKVLAPADKERKKVARRKKMELFTCCKDCFSSIHKYLISLFSKSILFDNVLADTENAFQAAAAALDYLVGISPDYMSSLFRVLQPFLLALSFVLGIVFTVVLILPSFFTLLIVRTTTTEKKSEKFGIRQEVIRAENCFQKAIRWIRILLRSLPMTFYILILPYILIYNYFPKVSGRDQNNVIIGYCSSVLVLQVLGTMRAYHSWKQRDIKPPKAPNLYSSDIDKGDIYEIDSTISRVLCCCFGGGLHDKKLEDTKPLYRSKFVLLSIGGVMLLGSLTLEFIQMATFALQNNPYSDGGLPSDQVSTTSSSGSGIYTNVTSFVTDVDFWGADIFQVVYVTLNDNMQYITIWCCICLVLLLILLFCVQFFLELRKYGYLMREKETKNEAKDHFFYSFTGSIVYGHGNPTNLSSTFQMVVAILTDGLFLVISLRLLDALACDYEADLPVLLADTSIVCWEGKHRFLAYMSMTCYAFYGKISDCSIRSTFL